jgi:hypothetical protein
MIIQRDLDTIGPRPPLYLRRPHLAGADPTLAAPPVSVAAVVTVRGPCPGSLLHDLHERLGALLGAGMRKLIVDLSEVADADLRLLRPIGDRRRGIDEAGGRLTLTDEGSAGTSPVLHADSRPDAFSTHASLRHPPSPSAPAADATTTGSGAA